MNSAETLKILAVLRAAYPQFYAKMSKAEGEGIVGLWADMFADEPYELVAMATKALIKTRESTFPPNIGEISAKIQQLTRPDEMSELEAWGLVSAALRNSAYGASEEFAKLPPLIQGIVGSPSQLRDWSQMDSTTVESVVASNFQRSYKARSKSSREYEALPASVKEYVALLADKMDVKQLEEKTG